MRMLQVVNDNISASIWSTFNLLSIELLAQFDVRLDHNTDPQDIHITFGHSGTFQMLPVLTEWSHPVHNQVKMNDEKTKILPKDSKMKLPQSTTLTSSGVSIFLWQTVRNVAVKFCTHFCIESLIHEVCKFILLGVCNISHISPFLSVSVIKKLMS